MRRLLNTLFILSEDLYLSLENENLVAWREKNVVQRIPLLNVENIFYFGYKGASPALLGACAKPADRFLFPDSLWKVFGQGMRCEPWKCIVTQGTVSDGGAGV